MLPSGLPLLGLLLRQAHLVRLGHVRHIEQGLCQLRVEGLLAGLIPLHLGAALHGQANSLDRGGLQDLALGQGTDHALT